MAIDIIMIIRVQITTSIGFDSVCRIIKGIMVIKVTITRRNACDDFLQLKGHLEPPVKNINGWGS